MIYKETKWHGKSSGWSVSIIDMEVAIRLTDDDRFKLDLYYDADYLEELAEMLTTAANQIKTAEKGEG